MRKRSKSDLIYEKIPPILGFSSIIFIFITSYVAPHIAALLIILLNVFFLYRSASMAIFLAIVLLRIRNSDYTNWKNKLEGLKNIDQEIQKLKKELSKIQNIIFSEIDLKHLYQNLNIQKQEANLPMFFKKIIFRYEKKKAIRFLKNEIKQLQHLQEKEIINPDDLRHIIILPHVNEPFSILEKAVKHLIKQSFPCNRISVVLASEAAVPEGFKKSIRIKEKYEKYFDNMWLTNHILQSNEIVGKSANMNWAGREAAKQIMKLGWDIQKVTITSCDIDSKLPSNYYSYLSYKYCITPDSKYKFFTGAMVLYNNIWRLPFYARVKNSMSTVYSVARLIRTDKLVPFSTYSTSIWLVDKIGYWTPWIVPEDFHLFFKALFKLKDKVETIPLYTKIMADSAEGEGHWKTIKNNYTQEMRWSWGISDDGWILKTIFTKWRQYSLKIKYMGFHVVFDHIFGPIGGLLVLLGGNIPVWVNRSFTQEVIGTKLPDISEAIIQLTFVFLLIVIFLDFFLKPRPENNSPVKKIIRVLEWFISPITGFLLNMLPGLEAHTRLLFGRYIEHYAQEKIDEE